jgi:hypothetical protein
MTFYDRYCPPNVNSYLYASVHSAKPYIANRVKL